jgi:hypothetical protein
MPLANALNAELELEGKSTVRMLERIPADKLEWRPHPKSLTLGRLAWHLVSIPSIAVRLVGEGKFDITNLLAIQSTLAGMDDDALKAPFTISRNGDVLNETRKIVFIRSVMMNHSYHHRGQLSVYLRLLDVPLPAIYGTSADEAM